MMNRIFPEVANNTYHGYKLSKWLLVLYVCKSFIAGGIHMFASDGGAQSIASVTLDQFTQEAADSIITMFGLWGMEQAVIGLIGLVILRRYQSLIPMMCGVYALEYIMRGAAEFYTPGVATIHTPPGVIADYVLIPMAILMFILSLKNGNN